MLVADDMDLMLLICSVVSGPSSRGYIDVVIVEDERNVSLYVRVDRYCSMVL
jgi:hypothetical protein